MVTLEKKEQVHMTFDFMLMEKIQAYNMVCTELNAPHVPGS